MFLLRIAEALVTSEESHLTLSNNYGKESTDCEHSTHKFGKKLSSENTRLLSSPQTPDATLINQPVLEGSEKLSRIHLTSSVDSSISSPASVYTLSAQSVNSSRISPYLPASLNPVKCNDAHTSKQVHQGLLYNLLISKENSSQNSTSSKNSLSTSPGQSTTENNERLSDVRIDSPISNSPLSSSCSSSFINPHHHLDTSNYSTSVRNSTVYSNFRHRANSLGCKLSSSRPYTRPHASSVGSASDFYPSLKARLQHRRHLEGSTSDSPFSKPKSTLYHRMFSKSQESAVNNSYIDIHSHSLSSISSSGISSPQLHHQSLSAQSRLMGHSSNVKSQKSSGFGSFGLQQSPQTSSVSNDSGSDEPIDLTGYSVPISPIITSFSLPTTTTKTTTTTTPGVINKQNGNCPYVQLAKKTARPVQARITEWLRQITEFVALSTPLVSTLKPKLWTPNGLSKQVHCLNNENDSFPWLSLLAQCWQKLLALSMVEHSLDVVVVEDHSLYEEDRKHQEPVQLEIPWSLLPDIQKEGLAKNKRPDRKFANELLQFLSEIRQAGLSSQEFYLLRHVILLTVDEPDTLPTLGLNVIRASRCMDNPKIDQSNTVASLLKDGTQVSNLSQDSVPPTVTFDLACLACGLKALRAMCPYRIASLFCSHLRNSSILNQAFILEMHMKYLSALKDLQTLSASTQIISNIPVHNGNNNNNNNNNNSTNNNNNSNNKHSPFEKMSVNKKSILEQLFDSV
uniref:Uncharacterized protein n=1 Tax=Trichobilharzia regenti TaxID=157069 RepID=A0AA85JS09_TRIRE|nr:unnamed protein product [Trichobilharzia regenti]